MNKALNNNLFFIKEHIGMFKAANNYDILNPESQEIIFLCREINMGSFTKMLRFTNYKRYTPFTIQIQDTLGNVVFTLKRGSAFIQSTVKVFDGNHELVGTLKQKSFSLGACFNASDAYGDPVFQFKGKWTGWDFKFLRNEEELGHVNKKWTGIGQELLTSSDNYMFEIYESATPQNDPLRLLMLATVICVDMVMKE